MNGDFGTAMVVGALMARGNPQSEDDAGRIGLVAGITAGVAGLPMGLVVAKTLTDQAAAEPPRDQDTKPTPAPPAPPPADAGPVVEEFKLQAKNLGAVTETLKGVAGDLKDASKSLTATSAQLEKVAKALPTQSAKA